MAWDRFTTSTSLQYLMLPNVIPIVYEHDYKDEIIMLDSTFGYKLLI